MERQIRVLVANRLKLMREVIIATIADQPDMQIVGEVTEDEDILNHIRDTSPDFLFVGLEEPGKRPSVCDAVLRVYPDVCIIAVAPRSNYSIRYWASFDIHSTVVETSESGILAGMRNRNALAGDAS